MRHFLETTFLLLKQAFWLKCFYDYLKANSKFSLNHLERRVNMLQKFAFFMFFSPHFSLKKRTSELELLDASICTPSNCNFQLIGLYKNLFCQSESVVFHLFSQTGFCKFLEISNFCGSSTLPFSLWSLSHGKWSLFL